MSIPVSIRETISIKLQAALRYGMVHGLTPISPLYIVNEYPKSGGTWVGQMLSEAMELPFPRNCYPTLGTSFMHGHYLRPWGMDNVLVVWRDGRDMMVSWYYHTLFLHQTALNARLVNELRSRLKFNDYNDIQKNLPAFIEHCFTRYRPMNFSWPAFVDNWHDRKGVTFVRYEDLRSQGSLELQRIVKALSNRELCTQQADEIIDKFSFTKQAGRAPGEENKNSFLRKGIVGDWQNQFTQEAREVFARYAGESLVKLGYEQNHQWVYA